MSRCSFEASRCRGDGRAVLLAILFLVAAARAPLAAAPAAPEWTVETVDGTIRFRRLVRLDEEARLAAARGDLGLLLGSSRVGSYERSHRPPRRGAGDPVPLAVLRAAHLSLAARLSALACRAGGVRRPVAERASGRDGRGVPLAVAAAAAGAGDRAHPAGGPPRPGEIRVESTPGQGSTFSFTLLGEAVPIQGSLQDCISTS